jgi:hypothetical protein
MRVSEILRKMAEIAELVDQDGEAEVEQSTPIQNIPAEQPAPIQNTPVEDEAEPSPDLNAEEVTMVSPQQQELELLKKSQGVDNNVSEFAGDDTDDDYDAELEAMKQMAGIGNEQEGPIDHAEACRPVSLNPRANAALEANNKPHLKHTQRKD